MLEQIFNAVSGILEFFVSTTNALFQGSLIAINALGFTQNLFAYLPYFLSLVCSVFMGIYLIRWLINR